MGKTASGTLPAFDRVHLCLEETGVPHLVTLGRVRYSGAHRPLTEHIHPHAFEICYLARGRQTYRVGSRLYHLRGNDVYITFPDERHDTGGFPEEKSLLYYFIVRAPRANERFLGLPHPDERTLLDRLRTLARRQFRATPALRIPLEDLIAHHAAADDPLRTLRIRHDAVQFLLALTDAAHAAEPTPQDGIARAQELVRTRLGEPIRLEEMAQAAGLSLPRFKAVFRETAGMPPREYVLREKIAAARQALLSTDADVTSIALDFGFSSSQYFATVFRRYCGMSPRACRAGR